MMMDRTATLPHTTTESGTRDMPMAPRTPEEAGLSLDLLIQLALKT